MKSFIETIKEKILNNIQINNIEIVDNTHRHKGHKNFDGKKIHLKIIIESDFLRSLNKIESHKKITNLLIENLCLI